MITGCGLMHSLVPGMNPVLLDEDDELDVVIVPDEDPEELLDVPMPPEPPLLFSTTTCELHPACISIPSVTSNALAKNSSDERRGFKSVRFMNDPPAAYEAVIMPHESRGNIPKMRRFPAPECAELVNDCRSRRADRNADRLETQLEM